jgi:hypothetical protein
MHCAMLIALLFGGAFAGGVLVMLGVGSWLARDHHVPAHASIPSVRPVSLTGPHPGRHTYQAAA